MISLTPPFSRVNVACLAVLSATARVFAKPFHHFIDVALHLFNVDAQPYLDTSDGGP